MMCENKKLRPFKWKKKRKNGIETHQKWLEGLGECKMIQKFVKNHNKIYTLQIYIIR